MKVKTKPYEEIIKGDNTGFYDNMIEYCDKFITVRRDNDGSFYHKDSDCYWYKGWIEFIEEEADRVIQICLDSDGGLFGLTEKGNLLYKERGEKLWIELDMERV